MNLITNMNDLTNVEVFTLCIVYFVKRKSLFYLHTTAYFCRGIIKPLRLIVRLKLMLEFH